MEHVQEDALEVHGGPSDVAVAVRRLVRSYRQPGGGWFDAVAGIDLDVRRGEVFALLGPNGAGKTTTLEIVEGLGAATSGTVRVLGLDVARQRREVKRRIGVQLQASSYFEHLTLREILRLFGSFYPTRRDPDELLELVGLADKRHSLVGELSGGQSQRFSVVAALVNDPEVVFLDEPTAGLDPQARRNLWALIRAINQRGHTVVFTTHYMEEAQMLADRVAIMDRGRLLALDTPDALVAAHGGGHRLGMTLDRPVDQGMFGALPGVRTATIREVDERSCDLVVADPDATMAALFAWLAATGTSLASVRMTAPTLEDVFIALTGASLRD